MTRDELSGNNNFYFNTVKLVFSSGTLSYDGQKRQHSYKYFMVFFFKIHIPITTLNTPRLERSGTKFSQFARLGRVETVAAWL